MLICQRACVHDAVTILSESVSRNIAKIISCLRDLANMTTTKWPITFMKILITWETSQTDKPFDKFWSEKTSSIPSDGH